VTDQIETAFVTQFQTNVAMLLAQNDSRLRGACTQRQLVGEQAEILEQFGKVDAVTGLPRHADTPLVDVPQARRWVRPIDAEIAMLEDKQDRLRMLIDPQGPYTMQGTAALNRKIDDVIVAGMLGTNYVGKDGADTESFSGQDVAADTGASADTGLNVAKLREARRMLRKAEVDFENETVYAALCADKENDLLNEAQVISKDFNSKPTLENGKISGYMGITFLHSERFKGGASCATVADQNGANGYDTPIWVPSGVAFAVWNDVNANVTQRADKRNAWQVYLKMTVGATRLELKRVVRILNVAAS
jgi:hypothetical protein